MGNTKLEKNPTVQDIKNFLGKIEENIDDIKVSITNETLNITSVSTTIIGE